MHLDAGEGRSPRTCTVLWARRSSDASSRALPSSPAALAALTRRQSTGGTWATTRCRRPHSTSSRTTTRSATRRSAPLCRNQGRYGRPARPKAVAEAWGGMRHELAPRGASGEPAGDRLCHLVSFTKARRARGGAAAEGHVRRGARGAVAGVGARGPPAQAPGGVHGGAAGIPEKLHHGVRRVRMCLDWKLAPCAALQLLARPASDRDGRVSERASL